MSPYPFPTTITITPRAPPQVYLSKTILFQAIQFSKTVPIKTIQFRISIVFVYTQLNIKTVLFQIIQFSVSTQFSSF